MLRVGDIRHNVDDDVQLGLQDHFIIGISDSRAVDASTWAMSYQNRSQENDEFPGPCACVCVFTTISLVIFFLIMCVLISSRNMC